MEYIQGFTDFYINEETAVTLGKFDGVHRGHRKLINRILELENEGYRSIVFALNGNKKELLLTKTEQRDVLEKMGVSYLIQCPFVPEITGMEAEQFVKEVLIDKLNVKHIVVGKDFRFGHNRSGDVQLLKELQGKYGYQVEVFEKETYDDKPISSTRIKEALKQGNMEEVRTLLGYPYYVSGEVLHGKRIGRTLGMPTTNLVPTTKKLLPPNGVYASKTVIEGTAHAGITNIGYKPTVGADFRGVETYIFDFEQNLYGENIEVQLWEYERPEEKFDSLEELKAQMYRDISFGKEYFSE